MDGPRAFKRCASFVRSPFPGDPSRCSLSPSSPPLRFCRFRQKLGSYHCPAITLFYTSALHVRRRRDSVANMFRPQQTKPRGTLPPPLRRRTRRNQPRSPASPSARHLRQRRPRQRQMRRQPLRGLTHGSDRTRLTPTAPSKPATPMATRGRSPYPYLSPAA